jgi:hypothetical protein
MKRIFFASVLLLAATVAHGSILLTTPYSVTGPLGVALGTATNATATSKTFNWQTNTACLTYSFGTVTASAGIDQSFTVLAGSPTVTNCLNLTSGTWVATLNAPGAAPTAIMSGVLSSVQLPYAIATYTGPLTPLRDAADYFAMGTFLPGTQPDLWGAGDL